MSTKHNFDQIGAEKSNDGKKIFILQIPIIIELFIDYSA